MKRCFDPKCDLVFLQFARAFRKLFEKCFGGEVKGTFVFRGELTTNSNNSPAFVLLLQARSERF